MSFMKIGEAAKRSEVGIETIRQCIEGRVEFTAMGTGHVLEPAQLLFLPPREPHSVKALEASSVLLTILKRNE